MFSVNKCFRGNRRGNQNWTI